MIEIPKQLQDHRFRFIKIDSGTKRPIEDNWQRDNNYKYDELKFKQYLKMAKSYGIVCGYNDLVIVDIENIDDKSLANKVIKHEFPQTFTVQTGGGGWHLYYKIQNFNEKIVLRKTIKNQKIHYGEIQANGSQCVGPGSLHMKGTKYSILNNNAIKEISKETLLNVVNGYYRPKDEDSANFTIINNTEGLNWNIDKLLKHLPDLKTKDGIVYRGPHPCHGSESWNRNKKDFNFEIDTSVHDGRGAWHCFRCETGGDAVTLIAMLENLVKMDADCPTKEQFKKVFVKAKEIGIKKYGYPKDDFKPRRRQPKKLISVDEALRDRLFYLKDGKFKIDHKSVFEYLDEVKSFIVVRDTTGRAPHIYLYENGYYRLNGDDFLKVEIKNICEKCGLKWQPYYEDSVMKYIKTENLKDRDEIQPDEFLVNFNNGVYNINTKKMRPHSPNDFFLYKIPWNYNPKIKFSGSKIDRFFKETLKPEYVKLSQELFGYCLYYNYKYHGIFYLYGTGGNGKSVWIKLLNSLLGNENTCSKSINSLVNQRFAAALLYGKLANICGEIGKKELNDTDMLKRLSSGDKIQAEFKSKDGFDFDNKAKIITACNTIPYCSDLSDGWYERQYIIPFLKKFRDSKQEDVNLFNKLTAKKEMEGLLSWAVEGLHRLINNEKFSYPWNKRERYLMYQQNTKYFVRECYECTGNINDTVSVKDIHDHYVEWCDKNDIPRDSDNALGRDLTYNKMTLDRDVRRYIKKR